MLFTGYALGAAPGRRRQALVLLVLSVALLFAHKTDGLANITHALNAHINQNVQSVLYTPLRGSTDLLVDLQEDQSRDRLLRQLIAENRILRAQNEILGDLKAENRRLHMLMDSVQNVRVPVSVAAIKDADIDGVHEYVTIGRGQQSGVYLGQPVIDPYGLVGQVTNVYPKTARVMLISDARSRVPVYVARTGQRGLVAGTSAIGGLDMPDMPLSSDIRVGDELISSGLGGIFPRGYPVARVTKIIRDQKNAFLGITLVPFAHLSSMLEVLLLDRPQDPSAQLLIGPNPPPPSFSETPPAAPSS